MGLLLPLGLAPVSNLFLEIENEPASKKQVEDLNRGVVPCDSRPRSTASGRGFTAVQQPGTARPPIFSRGHSPPHVLRSSGLNGLGAPLLC